MSVNGGAEVLIGGDDGNRASIRRCTKNGSEGWFDTEIEVRCDGWRGKIRSQFYAR